MGAPTPPRRNRPPTAQRYQLPEALEPLRTWIRLYGRLPGFDEYKLWARGQADAPSAEWLRRHHGGHWHLVLNAAVGDAGALQLELAA